MMGRTIEELESAIATYEDTDKSATRRITVLENEKEN